MAGTTNRSYTNDQHRTGDWMQVWGGGRVWPLDPRPGDVSIDVIAHSLACVNRFCGHTQSGPYSVAQHSVYVARCAMERHGPRFALRALLHDAHEAYVGDVVRPLLRSSPELHAVMDAARAAWDRAIGEAFGIDLSPTPEVRECDDAVLHAEKRDLLRRSGPKWTMDGAVEVWAGRVEPGWEWTRARDEFLGAYESYRRMKA